MADWVDPCGELSVGAIDGFHFLRQRIWQVDEIRDKLFDLFAFLVLNRQAKFSSLFDARWILCHLVEAAPQRIESLTRGIR